MNQVREPGVRDTEWLVMYEFPGFVLFGPFIVVGLLLALGNALMPGVVTERAMATTWALFLVLSVTALGLDFERNAAVIAFLFAAAALFVLLWISAQFNVPVFTKLVEWIGLLELTISAHTVAVINGMLGVVYLLMLANVWLNHRWIAAGEVVILKRFLRDQITFPLTAGRPPQKQIDDCLEYLLFYRAGTILLYDQQGKPHTIGRVFNVDHKVRVLTEFVQAVDVEKDLR